MLRVHRIIRIDVHVLTVLSLIPFALCGGCEIPITRHFASFEDGRFVDDRIEVVAETLLYHDYFPDVPHGNEPYKSDVRHFVFHFNLRPDGGPDPTPADVREISEAEHGALLESFGPAKIVRTCPLPVDRVLRIQPLWYEIRVSVLGEDRAITGEWKLQVDDYFVVRHGRHEPAPGPWPKRRATR